VQEQSRWWTVLSSRYVMRLVIWRASYEGRCKWLVSIHLTCSVWCWGNPWHFWSYEHLFSWSALKWVSKCVSRMIGNHSMVWVTKEDLFIVNGQIPNVCSGRDPLAWPCHYMGDQLRTPSYLVDIVSVVAQVKFKVRTCGICGGQTCNVEVFF
jgi:hypothetical protein